MLWLQTFDATPSFFYATLIIVFGSWLGSLWIYRSHFWSKQKFVDKLRAKCTKISLVHFVHMLHFFWALERAWFAHFIRRKEWLVNNQHEVEMIQVSDKTSIAAEYSSALSHVCLKICLHQPSLSIFYTKLTNHPLPLPSPLLLAPIQTWLPLRAPLQHLSL